MYIISRCLLGSNCKYNGGNNRCEPVIRFAREHSREAAFGTGMGKTSQKPLLKEHRKAGNRRGALRSREESPSRARS